MSNYLSIKDTTLTSIADAIRTKTKKSDAIYVSDMASNIRSIKTDAVLQEKTITENGEYTADSGFDGLGKVTVDIKSNTESENITNKPIRFYDPYGNIIYGYTRAEIQKMTELPPGPTLKGVTFERWTHTLDELKAITYFADVGPMYMSGTTPVTVVIIETLSANTSVQLNFYMWSTSYNATVNWGDGGTSTVKGTSSGTTYAKHKFTTAGIKIITIYGTTIAHLGYYKSSYTYGVIGTSGVSSGLQIYPDYQLKSILMSSAVSSGYPLNHIEATAGAFGLAFVSTYNEDKRGGQYYGYCHNTALRAIAGNTPLRNLYTKQHYGNTSLRRLRVSGTIADGAFTLCDSMEEVEFGSGAITDGHMNSKWAMLMTTETPPTIKATSPKWGTHPIYVPDSAVDAYKNASGWSNVAAYILPASQYPDK